MSHFDPVVFLYLNPELQASGTVTTVEAASNFYYANPGTVESNYVTTLSNLPSNFDPEVYLVNYKTTLAISTINSSIKAAMSNDGIPVKQIEKAGEYLSTIYQTMELTDLNTFSFPSGSSFTISASNLQVGDLIKILKNNYENLYARVTSINPTNKTFTVQHPSLSSYKFCDNLGTYVLVGIKLYDLERLARITFLRYAKANAPALPFITVDVDYQTEFNPDLYRLLYPDARLMTKEEAFLDYRARLQNEDSRVGIAADLFSFKMPLNIVDSISNNGLQLNDVFIANSKAYFNDEAYFKGPTVYKQSAVYQHTAIFSNISSCEPSPSPCPPLTAGFYGRSEFKGTLDVQSITTISGPTTITSNLTTTGQNVFRYLTVQSNADFLGRTAFYSNVLFSNHVSTYAPFTAYAPVTATDAAPVTIHTLDVTTQTTLHSNLTVYADATFHGLNTFSNESVFRGETLIESLTTYDVNILSQANFQGSITVGSNSTFYKNLTVHGKSFLNDTLVVQSNASIEQGDFTVRDGNVLFSGSSLLVDTDTLRLRTSDVYVESNLHVQNWLYTSNLIVDDETHLQGPTVMYAPLVVTHPSTFCNDILATQDATVTISNALKVPGTADIQTASISNLTVVDTVFVANASAGPSATGYVILNPPFTACNVARFQSNVFFASNTTVTHGGDAVFKGQATFDGNVFFGENIIGDELARLNEISASNLTVKQKTTVCNLEVLGSNTIFHTPKVQLQSNLEVLGSTYLKSAVIDQTTLCNNTLVMGPLTASNTVLFRDRAQFMSNVIFEKPVAFQDSNVTFVDLTGRSVSLSSNLLAQNAVYTSNLFSYNQTTLCNLVMPPGSGTALFQVPTRFERDVTTCNLTVTNELYINGTPFNLEITFSNARVSGLLTACNVDITNNLNLFGVDIKSNLLLSNANVSDMLTACNIRLTDRLYLSDHAFGSNALFQNADFRDTVTACNLLITKSITLDEKVWGNYVNFSNINVSALATACNVRILDKLYLNDEAFESNVTFSNATFRGMVTSCNVRITDRLFLGNTPLDSLANFKDVVVRGDLTTCNVDVIGNVDVTDTITTKRLYGESNWLMHVSNSNLYTSNLYADEASLCNIHTSNLYAVSARFEKLSVDLLEDPNLNITVGDFENAIGFINQLSTYQYSDTQITGDPDKSPFLVGFEQDVYIRGNMWVEATVTCAHLIAKNFLVQGIPTFCNQILALGTSTFCNSITCHKNIFASNGIVEAKELYIGSNGALFDGPVSFLAQTDFHDPVDFYDHVEVRCNLDVYGQKTTLQNALEVGGAMVVKGPATFSNPTSFTNSNTFAYVTVQHALNTTTAQTRIGDLTVTKHSTFECNMDLIKSAHVRLHEGSQATSNYLWEASATGLMRNKWSVVDNLKRVDMTLSNITVRGFAQNIDVTLNTGRKYYNLLSDISLLESLTTGNVIRIQDHVYEVSVATLCNAPNSNQLSYLVMQDLMGSYTTQLPVHASNEKINIEVLGDFFVAGGGGGGGGGGTSNNDNPTFCNLLEDVSTTPLNVVRFSANADKTAYEVDVTNHTYESFRRQKDRLFTLQTEKQSKALGHVVRLKDTIHNDGLSGNDTVTLQFESLIPWKTMAQTESNWSNFATSSQMYMIQLLGSQVTYTSTANISTRTIPGASDKEYEIDDLGLASRINRNILEKSNFIFNDTITWSVPALGGGVETVTATITSAYSDLINGKTIAEFGNFNNVAYAAIGAEISVPFRGYPVFMLTSSPNQGKLDEMNIKIRANDLTFSTALSDAAEGIDTESAFMFIYDQYGTQIMKLLAINQETATDYFITLKLQQSAIIPNSYFVARNMVLMPMRYRDVSVFANVHFASKLGIFTTHPIETVTIDGDLSCRSEFILRDTRTKSYILSFSNDILSMQDHVDYRVNDIQFYKDCVVRGNVYANSINQTSDRRLKRGIVDTRPQDDLERLLQLNVKEFEFIDASMGTRKRRGVIAQEVEAAIDQTMDIQAVQNVEGYIPYVYDLVKVNARGELLLPAAPFLGSSDRTSLQTGDVLRLQNEDRTNAWDVVITQTTQSNWFLTQPPLYPGSYFLYGYKDLYKVVDMDVLLMMTINAVKALAADRPNGKSKSKRHPKKRSRS